ncbi:hypothetical protein [Anaeromassilibacillus senegalensis]|uniref:hypothetical protein n=1 Tax=Anaeromassilibacillus senegalensis TaxID=1673717 RepID=UPI0012B53166|nr:hypothetical protein [Anaeromassilibacillus senegalensis]
MKKVDNYVDLLCEELMDAYKRYASADDISCGEVVYQDRQMKRDNRQSSMELLIV